MQEAASPVAAPPRANGNMAGRPPIPVAPMRGTSPIPALSRASGNMAERAPTPVDPMRARYGPHPDADELSNLGFKTEEEQQTFSDQLRDFAEEFQDEQTVANPEFNLLGWRDARDCANEFRKSYTCHRPQEWHTISCRKPDDLLDTLASLIKNQQKRDSMRRKRGRKSNKVCLFYRLLGR